MASSNRVVALHGRYLEKLAAVRKSAINPSTAADACASRVIVGPKEFRPNSRWFWQPSCTLGVLSTPPDQSSRLQLPCGMPHAMQPDGPSETVLTIPIAKHAWEMPPPSSRGKLPTEARWTSNDPDTYHQLTTRVHDKGDWGGAWWRTCRGAHWDAVFQFTQCLVAPLQQRAAQNDLEQLRAAVNQSAPGSSGRPLDSESVATVQPLRCTVRPTAAWQRHLQFSLKDTVHRTTSGECTVVSRLMVLPSRGGEMVSQYEDVVRFIGHVTAFLEDWDPTAEVVAAHDDAFNYPLFVEEACSTELEATKQLGVLVAKSQIERAPGINFDNFTKGVTGTVVETLFDLGSPLPLLERLLHTSSRGTRLWDQGRSPSTLYHRRRIVFADHWGNDALGVVVRLPYTISASHGLAAGTAVVVHLYTTALHSPDTRSVPPGSATAFVDGAARIVLYAAPEHLTEYCCRPRAMTGQPLVPAPWMRTTVGAPLFDRDGFPVSFVSESSETFICLDSILKTSVFIPLT